MCEDRGDVGSCGYGKALDYAGKDYGVGREGDYGKGSEDHCGEIRSWIRGERWICRRR